MSARYTLKILTHFSAAHQLRNYVGPCQNLHGHNWKVEVEVDATELDSIGLGIDFKIIKQKAKAICDSVDHRYLNEMSPFDEINPSAENIAAWFYKQLKAELTDPRVQVRAVTIWETDYANVRYTEDNEL